MRGDGRVYQRGNRYWIEYWVRGKCFRESAGKTEPEARRKLKTRRQEIAGDRFVGPSEERITVGELLDNMVIHLETRGARSVRSVRSQVKPIRSFFSFARAVDLTTAMVERYMRDRLTEGRKPATVNRGVQALRQAFRLAQRQGRLRSVPYFPQLKEENTRQGFFERGEFEKVASELPEPIADIAWFAFFSGWRKGEVLSLRWEDVDRHAKEIRLRTSKNGDGRVLPLAGNLWEILERRWAAREYEGNGVTTLADFVFHRKGRQIESFYKSWRTVCKQVGVDGRLFHDLRRTAGRNMIRAGVPETVARSITGHRTRSMFDRYNITSERDKVDALRKIDAHFESQPTTSKVVTIRPTK